MENIFDYIKWRGDLTIEASPFNEVDGVILARLAYSPFDKIGMGPDSAEVTIREAAINFLRTTDLKESVLRKNDVDLLAELAGSERFSNMKLIGYESYLDKEAQTQFSAVTIKISEDLNYVSFRGTDNTLIGWKEDFNMSFICPVPAQASAVKYLKNVGPSLKGNLIVGGHSKGGNLAVFAAAFCDRTLQDRIIKVYNFDGPGFDERVLLTEEYKRICERTVTFVPQSSIVGMLLEHEESYIVIRSEEKAALLQHNVYTWEVKPKKFTYVDNVTSNSRFIDYTLKGWVADMDTEQREKFVDAVYKVITKTKARTLNELSDNWGESAKVILDSIKNLDEPTRNVILKSISLLAKNAKKSAKSLSRRK